jgi:hypothetical protein
MSERERSQDPAEGADDPNVYEPQTDQPDEDTDVEGTDVEVEDLGMAMPGAGKLNEDPDDPGSSDPHLRTDGPAPLG